MILKAGESHPAGMEASLKYLIWKLAAQKPKVARYVGRQKVTTSKFTQKYGPLASSPSTCRQPAVNLHLQATRYVHHKFAYL